jgi:hypothetical protein
MPNYLKARGRAQTLLATPLIVNLTITTPKAISLGYINYVYTLITTFVLLNLLLKAANDN